MGGMLNTRATRRAILPFSACSQAQVADRWRHQTCDDTGLSGAIAGVNLHPFSPLE